MIFLALIGAGASLVSLCIYIETFQHSASFSTEEGAIRISISALGFVSGLFGLALAFGVI